MSWDHRTPSLVLFMGLLFLAGCSSSSDGTPPESSAVPAALPTATTIAVDPADVDSRAILIAAMTGQLLVDGAFQVTAVEAGCVATGIVEVVGGLRLAQVGITSDDPDGPPDDPYSALTADELADVVAVWDTCTDVAGLVTEALLSSSPEPVSAVVIECIESSLSVGLGARFLLAALAGVEGPDVAVVDVLRVLDGCTIGAQRSDLADADVGLWPWLSVDLPGYSSSIIDPTGPDATELAGFIEGVESVEGIEAVAMRVGNDRTGVIAAALIVASIDARVGGQVVVDDYAAGLLSSAEGLDVFEFTLAGGAEIIGWEAEAEDLVFLLWVGERVVVFATGGGEALDVLTLYSDLVPTP